MNKIQVFESSNLLTELLPGSPVPRIGERIRTEGKTFRVVEVTYDVNAAGGVFPSVHVVPA